MDLAPYPHGARLRALVGDGALALDVGGGTGRIARRLSHERVLVLDVERRMLQRARRRGFDVVLADAAALPVRDAAVDLALMVDALHHVRDQERALREAARVLRAQGRVVLEEFDPDSFGGRWIERLERLARFGSTFRRPDELRRMTEDAGLDARLVRHSARDYAVVGAPRAKPKP